MRLSVVILTCNQKALTLRCLESIRGIVEDTSYEVVLVDNGSGDGTSGVVADIFPSVRIIRLERNIGVAPGRNRGLREARGRLLMILDNDTVASSEAIIGLADYLDRNPDVGLVAPRLVSPGGDVQSSFRPYPGIVSKLSNIVRGKKASSVVEGQGSGQCEPFYVIGAAQMFPAEVYRESGGLDEHIFYGPEDADFCMAVRGQGKRVVYLPEITIIHDWQRAGAGRLWSTTTRWHIKGLLYFYRKHRRWL